ncbi:MAG: hypothetical protein Kow0069_39410 [Promethearchaeota archaeon]
MKTLKFILVGARYTGKGQVGRLWGRTNADLPCLQPVLLYDRLVDRGGKRARVVAWVVSFDPEFEELRPSFYVHPKPDGIVYTFDLTNESAESLERLDLYVEELKRHVGCLPPAVLVGTKISSTGPKRPEFVSRVKEWIARHDDLPYFEVDLTDRDRGERAVDNAFLTLMSLVNA